MEPYAIWGLLFILVTVVIPSGFNLLLLFLKPLKAAKKIIVFMLELICILFGAFCTLFFCSIDIMRADWFEQLHNSEKHSPLLLEAVPTFFALMSVALIGYIVLRVVKIDKMPPLCAVLCISAMYIGVIECILWCIQISKEPQVLYYILPANLILIFVRTVRDVVLQRLESREMSDKDDKFFPRILSNAKHWTWIAVVLSAPLLGVIVVILLLFGQKPDAVIKMWTETADWTMSSKIPPQNIYFDEHYLCTVAAGGHRRIVKPLRTGLRHGHRVVVNRQLMIANAFEQLIEERTPHFHKLVRKTYDKLGYPIARHIKSPYAADVIYFIMKPLEWMFLAVLYLFDKKPENRIAVQYPHSTPPTV